MVFERKGRPLKRFSLAYDQPFPDWEPELKMKEDPNGEYVRLTDIVMQAIDEDALDAACAAGLKVALKTSGDYRAEMSAGIAAYLALSLAALTAPARAAEVKDDLLEDKARLDFLDEANRRLNEKYGTTYRWSLIMNHNVNRLMLGAGEVDLSDIDANGLASCREAIDAVRGAKQ